MKSRIKIGVNDPCPCWSGEKYKHCCLGEIDWPDLLSSNVSHMGFLSARGRNILFAEAVFEALQLDNDKIPTTADYKRAFTDEAVRKIHESILELWPPETNLEHVLKKRSGRVSGIYIGDYEGPYLERAIVRHSLYADRIILADPFLHPHVIAPKFNPILQPSQHRAQTLKNVNRFFRFLPWVDAGLVVFTRTPADLDRVLNWETVQDSQNLKADPNIKNALDETFRSLKSRHFDDDARKLVLLSAPDAYLRRMFRENLADTAPISEDDFIEYVNKERNLDPDFLEPVDGPGKGQLHMKTTGGSVEIARALAEMSDSYLFTDLKVRWEILKNERDKMTPVSEAWSPFSKAVQEADFAFLNNVDLSVALRLRSEGRLQGVRSVLRKAWKADLITDEYNEKNAIHLADNLQDSIREADAEWSNIRSELTKYGAAQASAGLLAAGPLILNGHALWLAGAAIATSAGHSLHKYMRRLGFEKRFPASFFMNLTDEN